MKNNFENDLDLLERIYTKLKNCIWMLTDEELDRLSAHIQVELRERDIKRNKGVN